MTASSPYLAVGPVFGGKRPGSRLACVGAAVLAGGADKRSGGPERFSRLLLFTPERPPTATGLRQIMNAALYLDRPGTPLRRLPHDFSLARGGRLLRPLPA